MADHYTPGDFYRICDRTGFKVLASKTRKEWTGLIVRNESWEPRNAQDFVTGVRDDQSVWEARPRSVDAYVGPLISKVEAFQAAGGTTIIIDDTARMYAGDSVGIILDNGVMFQTALNQVTNSTQVIIRDRLPWSTSAGNQFVNSSAMSPPQL